MLLLLRVDRCYIIFCKTMKVTKRATRMPGHSQATAAKGHTFLRSKRGYSQAEVATAHCGQRPKPFKSHYKLNLHPTEILRLLLSLLLLLLLVLLQLPPSSLH